MLRQSVTLFLAAVVIGLFAARPVVAADKTHEGKVVSAGAGKLTMTMEDGTKKHTHEVPPAAKITVDGRPARLEDLKENEHIKVTTDENNVVKSIEARSK